VQRRQVLITPLEPSPAAGHGVRLHLPESVHDFGDVEAAVAYARAVMVPWMEDLAREAGADQVEVQVVRRDHEVTVKSGWGDRLYLGSELTFTAAGRPSPAARD
jgi:hypothetical protein